MVNCVSPDYVAMHGVPATLDDLPRHRLVHYVPTLGARSAGFEYVDEAVGPQARFLPMPGPLSVNNSEAYLAACLAGLGMIQVPEAAVRRLCADGRLLEVLPAWRAAPLPVSLLYAHRRHLPQRVQAFMAWVAEVLQPHLVPPGAAPA
jgi:DNA-binding transcriptional LysR family regulator